MDACISSQCIRSGVSSRPPNLLLVVVPIGRQLEIEQMVSNRDIGFVEVGQEAEIKVATFEVAPE